MNFQTQQVFNNPAVNTHSFDSSTHSFQPHVQQADSVYATTPQVPEQLPPLVGHPQYQQLACGFPPMQTQPHLQVGAPAPQTPLIPGMTPVLINPQTLPAQAVFPFPPTQYPNFGPYSTPSPSPMFLFPAVPGTPLTFQPQVQAPANMHVFQAVHGQVFPVMKAESEEVAVSSASSESSLMTSATPPPQQVNPELTKKQPPLSGGSRITRSPPGFEKARSNPPNPAKHSELKRSETINYARAAKARAPPTFKQCLMRANREKAPTKPERVPRIKRETIQPTKPNNPKPFSNRRPKKKYGFRSKQNMIDKVYEALSAKYTELGILASSDEVLRGDDTIRLHVKKFKALKRIQEALKTVERAPTVRIAKVSIPLSMKNQFQKKGFLVYVQVADVGMIDEAKRIFQQFEEFKKCEVARQTSDKSALKIEPSVEIVEEPLLEELAAPEEPAPLDRESSFGEVDAEASHEGWEGIEVVSEGAECGSLASCGLFTNDTASTGSPDFTSKKIWFADGDCGLDDFTLAMPPMTPKMSIGEAGQ